MEKLDMDGKVMIGTYIVCFLFAAAMIGDLVYSEYRYNKRADNVILQYDYAINYVKATNKAFGNIGDSAIYKKYLDSAKFYKAIYDSLKRTP